MNENWVVLDDYMCLGNGPWAPRNSNAVESLE